MVEKSDISFFVTSRKLGINRGAEGRILSIAQMERVSSRPRRVSSRHWRGITSSFCCIAACMHACMHARHGMRAASGARAPRRKAAGGQLETGSRQGTRWSGIKRSSPTGMYRGVKFYFPVENLPRSVTCYLIQRKKKKKNRSNVFSVSSTKKTRGSIDLVSNRW